MYVSNLLFSTVALLLLPVLTKANISGYGEAAGEGPSAPAAAPVAAASAAAADCGDIDSTSEAKANGPNPFCVYPALVGDHPSSGNRPGPTHEVAIPPGAEAPGVAPPSQEAASVPEAAPAAAPAVAPTPEAAPAPAPAPASPSGYSKSARFRAFHRL